MNKVFSAKSKIKGAGNGIFANCDIGKGEVIETCPIIEFPETETGFIEKSSLINYVFFFGKKREKIVLALGFGSIYNHSDNSNAMYKIKSKEKTIEFISKVDIARGEEITINYRGSSSLKPGKIPLWFER